MFGLISGGSLGHQRVCQEITGMCILQMECDFFLFFGHQCVDSIECGSFLFFGHQCIDTIEVLLSNFSGFNCLCTQFVSSRFGFCNGDALRLFGTIFLNFSFHGLVSSFLFVFLVFAWNTIVQGKKIPDREGIPVRRNSHGAWVFSRFVLANNA